jgi:hypothetical protein
VLLAYKLALASPHVSAAAIEARMSRSPWIFVTAVPV